MLKLSVTGDMANRLVLHSAEVCARSPQDSITSLVAHHTRLYVNWKIKTWSFRRVSLNSGSAHPTYLYLLLVALPSKSHYNWSTKPEPIVDCGCTRKLLVMKNRLIPLNLGGFPNKSDPLVTLGHPGKFLVTPGCPSPCNHSTQMIH